MTARSPLRSNARWLIGPALAAVVALAAACTKSESGTSSPAATESSATPAAASTAAPAAQPTNAAEPEAPADTATAVAKDAADAGRAATNEAKKDAGNAASAAASASAGPAECGTKPLPDCPLQAWMKAHANPPVMKNDLPALATALDKVVDFAPPGYTNWASIAKDGANAARGGDLTAAKASCRTCHDQYKQKYKTELRARKI